MTQEDKELLLKDISARLPYGVKCVVTKSRTEEGQKGDVGKIVCVCLEGVDCIDTSNFFSEFGNFKPYLFPLSSMSEEMLEELNANGFFKYRDTIANVSHLESKNGISEEIYTYVDIENISFLIEYFHSHHIDYRGLIPMGLAIDATGLNIYSYGKHEI